MLIREFLQGQRGHDARHSAALSRRVVACYLSSGSGGVSSRFSSGTGSSITSAERISTAGEIPRFVGLSPLRAIFLVRACFGLSFAKRFLGVAFAAVRFADLLRVDLEALRTLPRALDLLFLAVARFFRCAMIATSQHVYCGSVIKRQ